MILKSVAFHVHLNKEINVVVALIVCPASRPSGAARIHNRTHTHHKGRTQTQPSTNQCSLRAMSSPPIG